MSDSAPLHSPPPASTPAVEESGLIFDWSRLRRGRTRLLTALTVAAAGHVLLFYLFQVVTPPSTRILPPVRSTLLLSSAFPPAADLLERMEDEHPALMPPTPLAESDAKALHRLVKGYEPTWQNHVARLKPLPPAAEGAALPAVIPQPALLLPPLPAREPGPSPTSVAQSKPPVPAPAPDLSGVIVTPPAPRAPPALSVQSGLGRRALIRPPVWPAEVTQPDWPEEGLVSFLISVRADGKVLSCLPLAAPAGFEIGTLRTPLLAARFAPRTDSDETAWAWIDVQW